MPYTPPSSTNSTLIINRPRPPTWVFLPPSQESEVTSYTPSSSSSQTEPDPDPDPETETETGKEINSDVLPPYPPPPTRPPPLTPTSLIQLSSFAATKTMQKQNQDEDLDEDEFECGYEYGYDDTNTGIININSTLTASTTTEASISSSNPNQEKTEKRQNKQIKNIIPPFIESPFSDTSPSPSISPSPSSSPSPVPSPPTFHPISHTRLSKPSPPRTRPPIPVFRDISAEELYPRSNAHSVLENDTHTDAKEEQQQLENEWIMIPLPTLADQEFSNSKSTPRKNSNSNSNFQNISDPMPPSPISKKDIVMKRAGQEAGKGMGTKDGDEEKDTEMEEGTEKISSTLGYLFSFLMSSKGYNLTSNPTDSDAENETGGR